MRILSVIYREKSYSRALSGRCYCASTACAVEKDHKITQAVHQVHFYDIQILNCCLRHTWEVNTDLLYLGDSSQSPYFSVWFWLPGFPLKQDTAVISYWLGFIGKERVVITFYWHCSSKRHRNKSPACRSQNSLILSGTTIHRFHSRSYPTQNHKIFWI